MVNLMIVFIIKVNILFDIIMLILIVYEDEIFSLDKLNYLLINGPVFIIIVRVIKGRC
jgi:hypothetical protein